MTHAKLTSNWLPFLLLAMIAFSCKSEPKESDFTKATREVFFDASLLTTYDAALATYKKNPNLVDAKLFDSTASETEASHQFIFQKHPFVKEGLKAGSLYISRLPNDSAGFRQVIYFQSKEDGLKSFQSLDAKLRKPAMLVTTSDSTNKKVVMYAADKSDIIHGVLAELVTDSADRPAVLTLNVVKNQY
jgi:hypothetical protein